MGVALEITLINNKNNLKPLNQWLSQFVNIAILLIH